MSPQQCTIVKQKFEKLLARMDPDKKYTVSDSQFTYSVDSIKGYLQTQGVKNMPPVLMRVANQIWEQVKHG